jgi:PST family polysaccharide transporter
LSSDSKKPSSKSSFDSYGQILKSSSIIGGAQGVNYLISMIRGKAVAVLLGPSGIGLVGMYTTILGFIGTFASLGISSSAVREIAEADSAADEIRLAKSVKVLRRVVWGTGLLGWALTATLAWPLSQWAFGSRHHAWALALLGSTLFFSSIAGGQGALLQGRRRIADLARINVASGVLGATVSIALYAWLRERGIVPVMVASGLISLASSWWFARKVKTVPIELPWKQTLPHAKKLVRLGVAFMWAGILAAGITLVARSLIVKQHGLDGSGIYQAAWTLSGMFAGFILGAMGTDFYPRLTAVSHDHQKMNQMVNEQTEIGILLALPGLIATLMFAPWAMHLFYSSKFIQGAELLPWFVIGVFGRVVSWPMGFIMIAQGNSRLFAITETASNLLHILLIYVLMNHLGLWGVALAYAVLYFCYTIASYLLSMRLTKFSWSSSSCRLLAISTSLVVISFFIQKYTHGMTAHAIGMLLTLGAGIMTVRGLAKRLGSEHRITMMICKMPLGRKICGF